VAPREPPADDPRRHAGSIRGGATGRPAGPRVRPHERSLAPPSLIVVCCVGVGAAGLSIQGPRRAMFRDPSNKPCLPSTGESLDVQDKASTDDIVIPLVQARPGLVFLDVSETKITDESLKAIAELKQLKRLNISRCQEIKLTGFKALVDGLITNGSLAWLTFGFHLTIVGLPDENILQPFDIRTSYRYLVETICKKYPDGIGGVESNSNNRWHARFALEDRESEFPIDGDELLYDMLTWLKQRG